MLRNTASRIRPAAAAIAATLGFMASAAHAQQACSEYVVQSGDTLGSIAKAAYGSFDYQIIFNANRNRIVGDPNSLEEGTALQIPCEDGRLTADSEFSEVNKQQEEIAKARPQSAVYAPDVRFLVGDDWAPYTVSTLDGGGFALKLATTALQRGGNQRGHEIGWVNDISSHLYTLMPQGAYDVAVAWVVPDCAKNPDLMGENSLYRCNEFYATQPVYESVVGYYTRPDSEYADARSIADYSGAVFCRMEGFFTNDLEEAGLVEPLIKLHRPLHAEDCIKAVMDGTADATGMAVQQAVGAIASAGADGQVVQNLNFTHLSSIRFLAHKSNPWALQYVAMLNNGLLEMRETGEWYDIVSSTLAEYRQLVETN